MDYLSGPRPRLFAHRGGSSIAPENTLEAFRAGLAAGADRLELDVHATADGQVVVFHDATLDRTTDGSGPVREVTLAELRRLDAGARFAGPSGDFPFRGRGIVVPTLDELLEALPGVALNIEVKQDAPAIERAVLEVLARHGARDRVLLAAEDAAIMERIRAADPDGLTGFSTADVLEFFGRLEAGTLGGWLPPGAALQIPPSWEGTDLVTPSSVEAAHRLGLEVHVWTIDDPGEIDRLLDLGVDGIMTDDPPVAAAVFARRGLRPGG